MSVDTAQVDIECECGNSVVLSFVNPLPADQHDRARCSCGAEYHGVWSGFGRLRLSITEAAQRTDRTRSKP